MKKMQSFTLLAALLLALPLSLQAQKKSKGKAEPKVAIALQTGQTYTYRYTTKSDGEQNMMGLNITNENHIERQYTYEVLSVEGDTVRLKMTLDYAMNSMSNNQTGGEQYDSRKAGSKPHDAARFDAWLTGKSWTVVLDKYGKGTRSEGYQALYDKMIEEVAFKGPAAAVLKGSLTEDYKDAMVLNLATEAFGSYPAKATAKGANWKDKPQDDFIGERTFSVTEMNNEVTEVVMNRKIIPNPKAKPVRKPNGITVVNKMGGDQNLVTRHDPATKALMKRELKQNLSGTLVLSGGPLGDNPTNVEGKQNSQSIIEQVK
ncbi:MAG: hypothetical protein KF690_01370 [Bacteroidetes bacterium]|nr:hypothetical protein [Bacteroidota bacterium]